MGRHELTCEEVIEALFHYLDGELEQPRQEEIQRHLARCRDCFTRAEFERRLRHRVADTGTATAPERLRQRVRRLLEAF